MSHGLGCMNHQMVEAFFHLILFIFSLPFSVIVVISFKMKLKNPSDSSMQALNNPLFCGGGYGFWDVPGNNIFKATYDSS